jgi:hypothetical protein
MNHDLRKCFYILIISLVRGETVLFNFRPRDDDDDDDDTDDDDDDF